MTTPYQNVLAMATWNAVQLGQQSTKPSASR